MTNTIKITGRDAISYARAHGLDVQKYADPTEGARALSPDEAEDVACEDPSLLWVALTITIDPSDPFAGLVVPEEQGEVLTGWVREKGAEVLAVELLSAASGAGGGTWNDDTRRALVAALEKHAAEGI